MSKDNKKINKTKYLSGVIFFKMHSELWLFIESGNIFPIRTEAET